MDVKSAFLYGDIEEDVYLRLPKGVEKYEGKVLKLQKSLYGLKKSPRNWNNKFNNFMKEEGFIRSKADYCMYYKQKKRFYLLLYVDDLIIISEKQEDIDKLKEALQRNFQMTDQGSNKMRYLGINITVKDDQLELDQRQYLEGLLNKYGMNDCNPSATPVETGLLLSSEPATDSNMVKRCRQLVGSLMYAMLGTRPDICFAISYLSRYQVYADENLWKALKRVLRYIKGTLDYKLIYKKGEGETLIGYTDADWGGDKLDRKSTSGFIMKVYGCTVSWCSSKQQCTSLSSTESEYIALGKGVAEGCWIKHLLMEIGIECNTFIIYIDNQSAIHIAKNPEKHQRLKHIDLKYHFVRDKVESKVVELKYVPTCKQIADIFTKVLGKEVFTKLCQMIN